MNQETPERGKPLWRKTAIGTGLSVFVILVTAAGTSFLVYSRHWLG